MSSHILSQWIFNLNKVSLTVTCLAFSKHPNEIINEMTLFKIVNIPLLVFISHV